MPYSSTVDGSWVGCSHGSLCAISQRPMSSAVVTTAPEPFTVGPSFSSGRENCPDATSTSRAVTL
jgi:hypothetical protein